MDLRTFGSVDTAQTETRSRGFESFSRGAEAFGGETDRRETAKTLLTPRDRSVSFAEETVTTREEAAQKLFPTRGARETRQTSETMTEETAEREFEYFTPSQETMDAGRVAETEPARKNALFTGDNFGYQKPHEALGEMDAKYGVAADYKPSDKTMRYSSIEEDVSPLEDTAQKTAMSVKTKLTIAIYSAIIVVFAILVATTGVMIGKITADIGMLEQRVLTEQTQISDQNKTLADLKNPGSIGESAKDQGMTNAGGTKDVELLPLVDPDQVVASTNWFDAFCDWLSGVFGG